MLIWDLIKARVRWSRAERRRRLFYLCVQVQARLLARYPDYHNLNVQDVPPALAADVLDVLPQLKSRDSRTAYDAPYGDSQQ
jgi:hypothetical protein